MKMQKCDLCDNAATVFYRENVNGKVREAHLCAHHAAEENKDFDLFDKSFFADDGLGMFSLFSGLFPGQARALAPEEACPRCKTPLSRIRKEGRFGCPGCYDAFREKLDFTPFTEKGYREGRLAKAPAAEKKKKAAKEPTAAETVAELKKELKAAIQKEDYERCAVLRDKIRSMEG